MGILCYWRVITFCWADVVHTLNIEYPIKYGMSFLGYSAISKPKSNPFVIVIIWDSLELENFLLTTSL